MLIAALSEVTGGVAPQNRDVKADVALNADASNSIPSPQDTMLPKGQRADRMSTLGSTLAATSLTEEVTSEGSSFAPQVLVSEGLTLSPGVDTETVTEKGSQSRTKRGVIVCNKCYRDLGEAVTRAERRRSFIRRGSLLAGLGIVSALLAKSDYLATSIVLLAFCALTLITHLISRARTATTEVSTRNKTTNVAGERRPRRLEDGTYVFLASAEDVARFRHTLRTLQRHNGELTGLLQQALPRASSDPAHSQALSQQQLLQLQHLVFQGAAYSSILHGLTLAKELLKLNIGDDEFDVPEFREALKETRKWGEGPKDFVNPLEAPKSSPVIPATSGLQDHEQPHLPTDCFSGGVSRARSTDFHHFQIDRKHSFRHASPFVTHDNYITSRANRGRRSPASAQAALQSTKRTKREDSPTWSGGRDIHVTRSTGLMEEASPIIEPPSPMSFADDEDLLTEQSRIEAVVTSDQNSDVTSDEGESERWESTNAKLLFLH